MKDEEQQPWKKQLSFLDNPTQYSGDRVLDRELTIRLLMAILYQANAADQPLASEDEFGYGSEPWQEMHMMSSVFNPIWQALKALGAEGIQDKMSDNGEYTFGRNKGE